MYTIEENVIRFVFKAFQGLKRKKEDIDMVYHSIMVGTMLKNANCNMDTVCIGYLHDVIEDTECDYEELCDNFGKKLADSVMNLTEDKAISEYKERKVNFVNRLKTLDEDLLIVEVADKLHNLLSDYSTFQIRGRQCLATEADSYDNMKWFYLTLKELFNARLQSNELLDRYNEITKLYFEG